MKNWIFSLAVLPVLITLSQSQNVTLKPEDVLEEILNDKLTYHGISSVNVGAVVDGDALFNLSITADKFIGPQFKRILFGVLNNEMGLPIGRNGVSGSGKPYKIQFKTVGFKEAIDRLISEYAKKFTTKIVFATTSEPEEPAEAAVSDEPKVSAESTVSEEPAEPTVSAKPGE